MTRHERPAGARSIRGASPATEAIPLGWQACEAEGLDYAGTFRRQFILSEGFVRAPGIWSARSLGGWTLRHCPELPCRTLLSGDGAAIGLVLGIAITGAGEMLADRQIVDPGDGGAQRFIEALSGRYIALLDTGTGPRLFVDPSGSLGAYYHPQGRRVAGCIPLVLDRPRQENPDLPLAEYLARRGKYYMLGDTCDAEVRHVLPNHALDLRDFTVARHWPRDDMDLAPPESRAALLDDIREALRLRLAALTAAHACAMPVTGGNDSRFLLACMGDAGGPRAYFTHVHNLASYADSVVAGAICERMGLPHRIVSARSPGAPDAARLDTLEKMIRLRGSFQYRPDRSVIATAEQAPPGCEVVIRGGMIELLRSLKWKPGWGDDPQAAIDPAFALARFAKPRSMDPNFAAAMLPRYAEWMAGLPARMRGRVADFSHCELYLSSVNAAMQAGMAGHMLVSPFNDRALITAAMRLPHRFRQARRPLAHVVRHGAPELADVPFRDKALMTRLSEGGIAAASGRGWT